MSRERPGPARASSVWVEMPFMRGPDGSARLREWLETQRKIREQTAARRERVLRHEWTHARLCHILGLADGKRWNGFIPPLHDSEGRIDNNPIRAALIQLLRDVERVEANAAELAGAEE